MLALLALLLGRAVIIVLAGSRIVRFEKIPEKAARLRPCSFVLVLLVPEELGFNRHADRLGHRQDGCRHKPTLTPFARHLENPPSSRFRPQLAAIASNR